MRSVVFLLLICKYATAQVGDTLLTRILDMHSDTEKVNRLYKRGFSLRNNDPQQAFYYARLCEEQAQISESKKHLAKSYNLLGILYYKKGDYNKALAYHKKALSLRTECKDVAGIALSETNLGNIYTDLALFEKAEEAYLSALVIFRKSGDTKRSADCLINLGALKHSLKQHEAAFENYSFALKIAEQSNDYETRSLCLNNIAQVYFDRGDYEKSVAFNEDALKIRKLMDNNLEQADSYLNLASNFIQLNDPARAREYLDMAYCIASHYDYYEAIQIAFKIYSDYYSKIKNYELAYNWLKKYETGRDSVLTVQGSSKATLDFKEPEIIGNADALPKHITNLGLLISVLGFIILVPFILIRFKR